jgi:hypothetical protein
MLIWLLGGEAQYRGFARCYNSAPRHDHGSPILGTPRFLLQLHGVIISQLVLCSCHTCHTYTPLPGGLPPSPMLWRRISVAHMQLPCAVHSLLHTADMCNCVLPLELIQYRSVLDKLLLHLWPSGSPSAIQPLHPTPPVSAAPGWLTPPSMAAASP